MSRAALYLVLLSVLMIGIGLGGSLPALLAAPVLLALGAALLVISVLRDGLRRD